MGKTLPLQIIDAEDAPTFNRRSVRETPIEVITRGERRRIWTPEQKRDLVVESLEPGVSPIAVARRHGIGSGLLYTWRRQMVEGQLKAQLPVPPVRQTAASAALPSDTSALIEIVLPDGVTVQIGAAVSEVALRRVLSALGRR